MTWCTVAYTGVVLLGSVWRINNRVQRVASYEGAYQLRSGNAEGALVGIVSLLRFL